MGNPTSRQLQTLQPLSTFEFCPCGTDHDECVNDHALLTPLTLQIIMAIMVTHGAVELGRKFIPMSIRIMLMLSFRNWLRIFFLEMDCTF